MDRKTQNRKTARRLALIAVAMFGFGFALWPLYNVFCEVTGFGGRAIQVEPGGEAVAAVTGRTINIRFDASVNSSLPWLFQPKERTAEYPVGEASTALYLTMNPTDEAITGQATYNVSPPEASLYFVKTECFCFTEQLLEAGESREMPVYFYIKPDLPEHIEDITLSYTFYRQGYAPTDHMDHSEHMAHN
jgi:cytochrome c oxidase assembly protein subunit 11